MNVFVSNDALEDLKTSYSFYEKQQKGLGSYFSQCIERDLVKLTTTAGIHSLIRGYHHIKSERFNSIIFYRLEAGSAIVKAILDGRVNPAKRNHTLKHRL